MSDRELLSAWRVVEAAAVVHSPWAGPTSGSWVC